LTSVIAPIEQPEQTEPAGEGCGRAEKHRMSDNPQSSVEHVSDDDIRNEKLQPVGYQLKRQIVDWPTGAPGDAAPYLSSQ
jgi:hypothetical protein